ncbi:MAG: 1-acyl-sn-glycerol-3-phosphate acyltransferase [Firmicutes bacterium]|nr:1-acyl-sn-glycerol-3-phosphate acyltransferase [Bacillota bacterium]
MYEVVVALVRFFLKIFCGLKVSGEENLPEKGGAIIAANHTTWFDPFALATAVPRPVHFMAKAELFRNRILAKVLTKAYAFPVKRGLADRNAIRKAQQVVKEGHLLGIFPEGTRNRSDGEFLPLQGGTAFIALKSGVPVIPVLVSGVKPFRFRKPIRIVIGKPINLGSPQRTNKQKVEKASSLILEQFRDLISRNN